ncbi:hypothetical protein EMIHUDRAFT_237388, partial [Emiliania huxleyi CCMP1516]|uniref:Uncharacterized protein n=2 Tax=Emiliania huxleyi TaxID=2903 RepID=A0A0D3JQ37_EMIH1
MLAVVSTPAPPAPLLMAAEGELRVRLVAAEGEARAAKAALRESEARWRREVGGSQQERMRLRAEVGSLLQRLNTKSTAREGEGPPSPKRARTGVTPVGSGGGAAQGAGLLSQTAVYAMYHDAEALVREERARADAAEAQLSRLADRVQAALPVYQERSSRLDSVLEANAALSQRAAEAARQVEATKREAARLRAREALLRERLGHEQERLGAVAEAEGALRARLEES